MAIDWQKQFKDASTKGSQAVTNVRKWGLGEWGSLASIIGFAFYCWDRRKTK